MSSIALVGLLYYYTRQQIGDKQMKNDTRTNEQIRKDVVNHYEAKRIENEKIIAEFVQAYKAKDVAKAESLYIAHQDLGFQMQAAIKAEGLE